MFCVVVGVLTLQQLRQCSRALEPGGGGGFVPGDGDDDEKNETIIPL